MNAERRKTLNEALTKLVEARDLIQGVLDEEQESYDNMPESFQNGSKGEAAQECIDNLQTAIDDIENVENGSLGEIANG